nr:hypothetical protein [uncultured Dyadobacter sp.]
MQATYLYRPGIRKSISCWRRHKPARRQQWVSGFEFNLNGLLSASAKRCGILPCLPCRKPPFQFNTIGVRDPVPVLLTSGAARLSHRVFEPERYWLPAHFNVVAMRKPATDCLFDGAAFLNLPAAIR